MTERELKAGDLCMFSSSMSSIKEYMVILGVFEGDSPYWGLFNPDKNVAISRYKDFIKENRIINKALCRYDNRVFHTSRGYLTFISALKPETIFEDFAGWCAEHKIKPTVLRVGELNLK